MMLLTKGLAALFMIFGLLIASQSFAGGGSPDVPGMSGKGAGDHHSLALYYEEQAELNKGKAQDWEFAAEYYEKFPGAFSGTKMTAAEHIAHCRSIAEDFRKAEAQNRELAAKHRALMRKDFM